MNAERGADLNVRVSIIVAMARNRIIGARNSIPWRLRDDLAHFQALTRGHWLLVGRKTYESIGWPLPNRRMVVLSRHKHDWLGVNVAHSIEQALQMASGDEELFVAGGGQIYRQVLDRAHRIHMTFVEATTGGNVSFPEIHDREWELLSCESHPKDARNEYAFHFLTYERRKQTKGDRNMKRTGFSAKRRKIELTEAPPAVGPYSQAVAVNGFLFLSGQIPLDPSGKLIEGDVAAQTEQVLKNISAVLAAAGTDLNKVVKTTVYLKDMNDFARMNEVYGRFFTSEQPARATVEVARLPKDVRVEIEAIAAL